MKKLTWVAGIVAVASLVSVYAEAEEVDFRAANPVLQSLVDAVTAADDLVDFAYPKFDEAYSDLKAEKLKYDAHGSLKNTPWLDGGRADATGTSKYWTERSSSRNGIHIEASAVVRTDVMALIRYGAYIAIRKTPERDIEPKFVSRYFAHLKRLAVATSLEQVHEMYVSGLQLAKDMWAYEIEKDEERLKCLESGKCPGYDPQQLPQIIARAKARIADDKKSLAQFDQIAITTKSESGKVRELSLCSPDIGLMIPKYEIEKEDEYFIPAKGCGVFTDTSVSATMSAFAKLPVERLDRMKNDLKKSLVKIQNGDSEEKDLAQDKYRQALVEMKRALRGEW